MDDVSNDPSVRITNREIYDAVLETKDVVRDAVNDMTHNEQAHALAHQVHDKRLENHGDRIRDVEAWQTRHAEMPAELLALKVVVHGIETTQNRSAWVTGLIGGLVPTVVAALAVWALVPKA